MKTIFLPINIFWSHLVIATMEFVIVPWDLNPPIDEHLHVCHISDYTLRFESFCCHCNGTKSAVCEFADLKLFYAVGFLSLMAISSPSNVHPSNANPHSCRIYGMSIQIKALLGTYGSLVTQ